MGWHYIEFITRNSRMDGKRVQCFHRKGSTRIQHVEVSQTFTKWSNCCIHRGYVLSWLSLKMYIQVFSWPRSYFDLFYMLEILSASHCIRALWLRIMWKQLWYVFPIPFLSAGDWILCDLCLMSSGRSWQKDTKQPNKYVIYIYIYIIYIYICKIHILLVVKFKFKAKLLQFPDALTFFLVELPRCPTAIPSCQIITPKTLFCMYVFFLFPLLRFSSKRRTYPCRQAETCFAKQVSWSVFCGSFQLCLTCNLAPFPSSTCRPGTFPPARCVSNVYRPCERGS